MYRLLTLFLYSLFRGALAHSETDLQCIATYNGTLSNDFLVGDWRVVYLFASYANPIPSSTCSAITFTEFTQDELAEYRQHYTDTSKPYDMSDRPIKYQETSFNSRLEGMVMGSNEVKYLVLKPTSAILIANGYEAQAYRRISDSFVLFVNCDLRSRVMWLYSKGAEIPSVETLDAVIGGIAEVKDLKKQRYCA